MVENAIWRAMKPGDADRREALRLLPAADLNKVPHPQDSLNCLWLDSIVWAADGINRSATSANPKRLSPHKVFTGKPPHLQIVPFLQSGLMRVYR